MTHAVLFAAAPAIDALAGWLTRSIPRQSAGDSPPPVARALVGLGPGLTPSGDDYLGGVMIGLRTIARHDLADHLARLVLPHACRATGAISNALLACAARGAGSDALHGALAAVAAPEPPDMTSVLTAIARTGATSGWDALAGATLPLCIRFGTRPPVPWQAWRRQDTTRGTESCPY